MTVVSKQGGGDFNPRPREGSDNGFSSYSTIFSYFNPRPREGSDKAMPSLFPRLILFQSTPPRGERPTLDMALREIEVFQSTPPRGERHHRHRTQNRILSISIHAPARGATIQNTRNPIKFRNFNPRPREGSDPPRIIGSSFWRNFNPRPREGSDPCYYLFFCNCAHISIHAPARGATPKLTNFYPK